MLLELISDALDVVDSLTLCILRLLKAVVPAFMAVLRALAVTAAVLLIPEALHAISPTAHRAVGAILAFGGMAMVVAVLILQVAALPLVAMHAVSVVKGWMKK